MARSPRSIFIFMGILLGSYLTIRYFNNMMSEVLSEVSKANAAGKNLKNPIPEPEAKTFEDYLGVPQDDPNWISFLRREVVQPPSKSSYKLKNPEKTDFSEHGQSILADDRLFKKQKNGFFIEVGAINGEFLSNTLYFEREHQWTGLLIEPNFDTYSQLLTKGRKSYTVNGALSPVKAPSEIKLRHVGLAGKESIISNNEQGQVIKAYPLYSLLLAINVTTIDFLSLDVESQEMKVLKTLPWDKLKFKVLCIEKIHVPEGVDVLVKFVQDKGYKFIGHRTNDAWFVAPEMWHEGLRI